MSDRERKLVLLFGLAAFVLVNVFFISWFKGQKLKVSRDLMKARAEVASAEAAAGSFETVEEEMIWLNDKTPSPKAGQLVATELETYASNQANTHQLKMGPKDIKPNEESGKFFHRARVQFKVTGREDSLYKWLDRLQMPDQLKGVTFMRLAPDAQDDTLIDATVVAEQWYVPLTEGSDGGAPEETPTPGADAAPSELPAGDPTPTPAPTPTPGATPAPTPDNIQPETE